MNQILGVEKQARTELLESIQKLILEGYEKEHIRSLVVRTSISERHLCIENAPVQGFCMREDYKSFSEAIHLEDAIQLLGVEFSSNLRLGFKFQKQQMDFFDTIEINLGDSNNHNQHPSRDPTFLLHLHKTIRKFFSIKEPVQIQHDGLLDLESKKIKFLQHHLDALNNISSEIIRNISKQTESWGTSLKSFQEELEKAYLEKERLLNEKNQKRNSEIETREKEFETSKKEFDDRARTVVRRDLLKQIKEIVASRKVVELSEKTAEKKSSVDEIFRIVLWASGIFVTFFTLLLVVKLFSSESVSQLLWAPVSFGAITFVTTIIFYIRWRAEWFRVHSEAELFNQKFEADILRANWIVETFFEWREEKQIEFPREILVSFARNLFDGPHVPSNAQHPIEDFIGLANNFSKMSLGKGIIELETKEKVEGKGGGKNT